MYVPSREQFREMTKRGNLIPVYREILADMETPVSAYLKIDRGDYAFLLESVEGGERVARYSFLGAGPSLIFTSKSGEVTITDAATGAVNLLRNAVAATQDKTDRFARTTVVAAAVVLIIVALMPQRLRGDETGTPGPDAGGSVSDSTSPSGAGTCTDSSGPTGRGRPRRSGSPRG